MTSYVRLGTFAQKKDISVAAYHLVEGTDANAGQIPGPGTNDNYHLGNLPPKSIILDASIFVITASDAATSAVGTLGTASAGTQIVSAADLTTTGDQGTFTGQSHTGTGVNVWFGVTYTGAGTNVGEYVALIEYLEYTKNTGEYTTLAEA